MCGVDVLYGYVFICDMKMWKKCGKLNNGLIDLWLKWIM